MSVFETAKQWADEGEFDAEFRRYSLILSGRKFTREQILACFEVFAPAFALAVATKLSKVPSLEEVRAEMQEQLHNATAVIENSWAFLSRRDQPEDQVIVDALRRIANRGWQTEEQR